MSEQALPERSLADRARSGEFGTTDAVHVCDIPGEPQGNRRHELLLIVTHFGSSQKKWVSLLTRLGYGGSTVIVTISFDCAEGLIRTGRPVATLHHDADLAKKQYRVDEMLARAKKDGIHTGPVFIFTDPFHVEWAESRLREFLAKHCPLA